MGDDTDGNDGTRAASAPPWETIGALAALFGAFDGGRGIAAEEQWTLQVLKLAEEVGEAAQAVVGARATNPRKGRSHSWEQVQEEVADVVITGMVTLARMRPADAREYFEAVLAVKSAKFLPGAETSRAQGPSRAPGPSRVPGPSGARGTGLPDPA
ncbi:MULTISPECIES: MazG-like family protein [unclassified Streptomyces]|uniref:MazG-like family protein n=1 Tax=unclassified Streptomyces TaxID=2593676 RepID=UPI001CB6BB3B|nr:MULTISPECIES: MazG-like family protein [unclassified Streptomyces]